jgi:hypothetical protein
VYGSECGDVADALAIAEIQGVHVSEGGDICHGCSGEIEGVHVSEGGDICHGCSGEIEGVHVSEGGDIDHGCSGEIEGVHVSEGGDIDHGCSREIEGVDVSQGGDMSEAGTITEIKGVDVFECGDVACVGVSENEGVHARDRREVAKEKRVCKIEHVERREMFHGFDAGIFQCAAVGSHRGPEDGIEAYYGIGWAVEGTETPIEKWDGGTELDDVSGKQESGNEQPHVDGDGFEIHYADGCSTLTARGGYDPCAQ